MLFLELLYFVFWFSSMFVVVGFEEPPPVGPLVPGLPLSVYDGVAEYRLSHFKLFAHFFSPAATFQLVTGIGTTVTPWFWLIIGMVIGTDAFSTMENYLHLSPDRHPHFYKLEVILSISALALSVLALFWFTALYMSHTAVKHATTTATDAHEERSRDLGGFMLAAGYSVADAKNE